MNHSLLSADRNTHVKIVVVALLAAILIVGVGIKTRVASAVSARNETGYVVLKAGKPAVYTRSENLAIR
jgi:hypothetical protein